jgi:predicted nucleic acid-binding protein
MSQPAYPGSLPASSVAARLGAAMSTRWHAFWPDSISLVDGATVDWDGVLGSRQVTDVYLLALAVRNEGRLVTFDRGVPLRVVAGASARHLAVI